MGLGFRLTPGSLKPFRQRVCIASDRRGACQEATSVAIYMIMLYELQVLFLFAIYCV